MNFDGTTSSPCTIRASYNVSSVTKSSTGKYTINFSTPMTDANYCPTTMIGVAGQIGSTGEYGSSVDTTSAPTSSAFSIETFNYEQSSSTTGADRNYIFIQVFGN